MLSIFNLALQQHCILMMVRNLLYGALGLIKKGLPIKHVYYVSILEIIADTNHK
jgi:hypothetical protein